MPTDTDLETLQACWPTARLSILNIQDILEALQTGPEYLYALGLEGDTVLLRRVRARSTTIKGCAPLICVELPEPGLDLQDLRLLAQLHWDLGLARLTETPNGNFRITWLLTAPHVGPPPRA